MLSLIVKEIIEETEDTKSFVLEQENGQPISYQSGQFITLVLLLHGRELRRSYSMSSSPRTDQSLTITVKRIPNGEVSRYLLEHARIGTRLQALEPSGRFTIDTDPQLRRDIFLFAAGSGITPIISLLKQILVDEPQSKVILVTQNRHEDSIIFRTQLAQLSERYPQLNWISYLGFPREKHSAVRRLNVELLTALIQSELRHQRDDALFFTCGPIAFMRMTEFTVRQLQFSEAQVRKEIFVLPSLPVVSEFVDAAPRKLTITFKEKVHITTLSYPSSLLDAAWRVGVEIPFSCKAGVCSTCIAKCVAGKVKMKNNEVLTEQDLQAGLVLTCVGYAETDVELKI